MTTKYRPSLLMLLALLSAVILPGVVVGQQTAQDFVNLGKAKMTTNDFAGAIADFTTAIELSPKDADALNNRGYAKELNGDLNGAIADFTKVIEINPKDPDAHRHLAYALYRKDPEYKDIDRIIVEGETALKLAGRNPLIYQHLGAYYRIKGDLLARRAADGTLIPSPESRSWYQKSINTLGGAIPLDHEFNDDNRRQELQRGRKGEDIPDIGNHEIYWNLGLSHMRIGNQAEALKAYRYMQHLAPTNTDSYLSIASVYLATGKNEDAAIALLQALLLDSGRQEALRLLVEVYREIDREGCAVIVAPNRPTPQLNADCALVHSHICRAYAGLSQVFTKSKSYQLAQQTRESAITNYKCPPELFEPAATTAEDK